MIPRKLLIFGIIVPLAAMLGYLLSSPDFMSFVIIGGFVSILLAPVFLRWHHVILIASWNLAMTAFFLPGNPPFWMLAALISLGVSLLHGILDKQKRFCGVPSVTWSLILLALVVLFTIKTTGGGFGLRSMGGSTYGGRKYVYILMGVVAYFALSVQSIQTSRANATVSTFFLSGVTPAVSNLIYFMGPSMWILYDLFSVDWAVGQALEDMNPGLAAKIGRLAGMAPAGMAVFFFMLARFGLKGILDWTKPWRAAIFATALTISLLGGFRSLLVICAAIIAIQFYLEGLHRTTLLPVVLVSGMVLLAAILPFANKLPRPIQRALSIFPVNIDPGVRLDARASTEWRLRMWEMLLPEVPRYLWIGKGCAMDATDYFLSIEAMRRGISNDYEFFIVTGDYHNGPLSVLIPFGLPGALAFAWFLIASSRVMIRNYRYGDPTLKQVNTFLLACFVARVFFFLFVFGGLHSDIVTFAGIVGLSVSLNRGMCRVPEALGQRARENTQPALTLRPFRA